MTSRFATLLLVVALMLALAPHCVVAATLSKQEAIAKVQRETQGKVLSAETKSQGRRVIYRIKVLTRDGQVKVIEVPADE